MHPQTEFLLNHSASASPFASTAGQAFVSLPLGACSHQVCSILSPRFRDWLIDAFYRDHGEPPADYALRQTIRTLEARALSSGPRLPVHRRIAARGNPCQPDAILLDLDNADGEIVEITPAGWQITTDPTAAFLHSRGNAELPPPTPPSPPANASPNAGIRGLGSNAGSNAAAGTCVHSLCAGRRASAVVGNGRLAYHDDGPREHVPKGQPGGNALTFASGAYRNREVNLYFRA